MTTQEQPWVCLLRPSTTLDDYRHLAEECGWSEVGETEGDGRAIAFEEVRRTEDGSTHIHYLDDPVSELRFVVVRGPEASQVAWHLGAGLSVKTDVTVVGEAEEARTDEEKMTSAMELAVVFKQPDARAMRILRGFYKDGSEALRRRVMMALGYRGWPEAVDFLDEIAHRDASDTLRADAGTLAGMWRAQLAGESPKTA
jgi:hypothetical protein